MTCLNDKYKYSGACAFEIREVGGRVYTYYATQLLLSDKSDQYIKVTNGSSIKVIYFSSITNTNLTFDAFVAQFIIDCNA